MVTVRSAPLPPKAMLPFGINEVLDEEPDTIKSPAGVSASPTVKAIAPVGVSSSVFLLVMSEMVGAAVIAKRFLNNGSVKAIEPEFNP